MRVDRVRVTRDGTAEMAFGLGPIAICCIRTCVNPIGDGCSCGVPEKLLRLLLGGFAVGLAKCKEQIWIVGELRSGLAQLKQSRIHLSCIPERGPQPALAYFILRIKSYRLAQVSHTLRRVVQSHFVNSQPKIHATHSGPQLFSRSKSLCGILEFSVSIVGEPQVYINLGQSGLEPQDLLILGNRVMLPALLCLLRCEEVFLYLGLDL